MRPTGWVAKSSATAAARCRATLPKPSAAVLDFVMLGGMLAGHDECEGTVVEENGEKFMLFYGMSSESAMKRHVGGVAEYRAAEQNRQAAAAWRGGVYRARYPRRPAFRLHLRWCRAPEKS